MSDNSKTLKVIRGIAAATAKSFDGAYDENGDPLNIGLNREKGDLIKSSRRIDGWGVTISADKLFLSYQDEVKSKEVLDPHFDNEINLRMNDIVKWIKKEYRKSTGESLTLDQIGECDITVRNISRVRSWIEVKCVYKIPALSHVATGSPPVVNQTTQDFVKMGGWGDQSRNKHQKGPDKN